MSKQFIRVHGSGARSVKGGAANDDPNSIVPVIPSHLGGTIRPNISGFVMVWLPVPYLQTAPDTRVVGMRMKYKTNRWVQGLGGEIFLRKIELVRDAGEPQMAILTRGPLSSAFAFSEVETLDRSFFGNGDGVPLGDFGMAVGIQLEFNPREEPNPDATFTLFSVELELETAQ